MNIKLIACKVLSREVGLLCARCPNFIDITYIRQGYHDQPEVLRRILQHEIDLVESGDDPHTSHPDKNEVEAIALGYGLCSGGVKGLVTKKYPLVIPRAHDCITLFLGSKERYREYFDAHPGTYWYTHGWIDNTNMPGPDYLENYRRRYERDYDEDEVEFLLDTQNTWLKKYDNAAYVRLPEIGDDEKALAFTKDAAESYGWGCDALDGDLSLLKSLLWGDWRDGDFLVVRPGQTVDQCYEGERIIEAK